jgi:hypothetical protein
MLLLAFSEMIVFAIAVQENIQLALLAILLGTVYCIPF